MSNVHIAQGHHLYYVETQRKSNTLDDYGQFLFSVIPDNLSASSEEKKLAITFFTVCIPVNNKTPAFLGSQCPLDSCKKQLTKGGLLIKIVPNSLMKTECEFIVDRKNIQIVFHLGEKSQSSLNFLGTIFFLFRRSLKKIERVLRKKRQRNHLNKKSTLKLFFSLPK